MESRYILLACTLAISIFGDAGAQQFGQITHYIIRQASMVNMSAYPFTVGEYNKQVVANYPQGQGLKMRLPFSSDAIAYIFIFDYGSTGWNESAVIMNSLAESTKLRFPWMNQTLYPANDINNATNLPFIHTQTAGNAAGGAFYYQESQVTNPPSYWQGKSIYGSSVHPWYRLKTGFAGAIVFPSLKPRYFWPKTPFDIYKTEEEKIMLLNHNYMVFFKKCPFDDSV